MSLSTLWAFAASTALGDGLELQSVQKVHDNYGYPAGALGSALQAERRMSMVYLGSKAAGDQATVESVRLVTDRQADLFRRLAMDPGARDAAPPQAKELAGQIITSLDALAGDRAAIDLGRFRRAQVFSLYTGILGHIGSLQGSLSTLRNSEVAKDARNQVAMTRAREALSQEDALIAGAIAARRMTAFEHAEFTKLVGAQHSLYSLSVTDLRDTEREYFQRVTAMPEYATLRRMEQGLIGSVRSLRTNPNLGVEWKTTADSNLTRLRGMELASAAAAELRAQPIASSIILRVILAGVLGLVAVLASLILAIWLGRSVIRDLTGLRREALDLANTKLPGVVKRLRNGEKVDVGAEAPPLSFSTEEINQVGQAFNAARRTAIQGAVEEAALRQSISDVFVNLARRSQSLLHRQLKLLDTMERRNADPEELEDLFRLDHLATRMRRHSEGLIILSGQAPGRGWRNPVGVLDVARAAASEVEDYKRVTVSPMPEAAISGKAVADVIHLLAELIENATMFSPTETSVQVTGQVAAHGFSLEIEDRGLSMDEESLVRANERLSAPPEFDLSDSAQLGLFVVGRLAKRHKIKVTLRTSPFGGMTAIVLFPEELVVRLGDNQPESKPLALTRRSEDALVPLGAVRPDRDADANGSQIPRTPGQHRAAPRPLHEVGQGERKLHEVGSREVPTSGPARSDGPRTAPQPFQLVRPASGAQPPPGRPKPAAPQAPAAEARPASPAEGSQRRTPPPVSRRGSEGGAGRPPGARGGRPPLPQRVKQTSLAPQLYDESASAPPPVDEPVAARTPEQMRSMLSSIQQGTRRGRSRAAEGDEES
ncbi:MAG TPA: nitrate- and nitrite sensing domain-containing protein [Actinomadura sp.]|nr:nitrate- and nitrite sensing domain-containing protein [Actinomadura sp.]